MQEKIISFCRNLYQLRSKYGLSRREMARMLEISSGKYSKLESGMIPTGVPATVLWKIYEHFGVGAEEMFAPEQ